ncbi:MAG: primosomal protein N' [Gemmataceae bacterium]|nr:primosomal protein N' [Gemmataceae bacterium]MDW8244308.1 primosomal protein N' [Thermogemmata sp.]
MTGLFDTPRRKRRSSTAGAGPTAVPLSAGESGEQAPSKPLYAEVVFDRPLDQAWTYAIPPPLVGLVQPGKRVAVPLGKRGKETVGFCVRVSEMGPPPGVAVKPIWRVLDEEALVDDHLLQLTRWMADYYLCGWGQVLHAVVPAGVRDQAGLREIVQVEAVPPAELPDPLPTVTPAQKAVWETVQQHKGTMELRELLRQTRCSASVVRGLVHKGLLRLHRERVEGTAAAVVGIESSLAQAGEEEKEADNRGIVLNADQQRVWGQLEAALQTGGFRPFLLHGVTGSGKTEIYLRAMEAVVRQGRQVVVLVPEIALTPQTIARFRQRGNRVAVLHSHLTDAERGGHWRRIAAGEVEVVVGARSAVFAPVRKLGLIVIDEEHEHTFKQEATPRYHARDVAVMRARLAGVPVVLGSATPSLESWWNAARGQYTLLSLPKRVESRPLPAVRLIDLRHEVLKNGALSPTLVGAMDRALHSGGQVLLLLNRRGYSTYVHCHACGYVAQCSHCDIALTFHRSRAALLCHYCGWQTAPYQRCPACDQPTIRYQGLGTEKLQAEIEDKFPGYVCRRMDSDTTVRRGSHESILKAFRDGKIHILLGTQMIAKGLDFPNVTLVGVINADVGLHVPDFRSAERTFQLLAQVAGRAGRGAKGGVVYIQTYTPDHPCIALAARHDYVGFASQELAHRRQHRYPPFERLARLIIRSQDEGAAAAFAETLGGALHRAVAAVESSACRAAATTAQAVESSVSPVRILGPAECPVYRLHNYYRFHFQVQSADSARLHAVLRRVVATVRPPAAVEFQVDIDPYSML